MNNVFSKKKVLLSDIYGNRAAVIAATKQALRTNTPLFTVCNKKKSITFSVVTCFCSSTHTLVPSSVGAKSVDSYSSNLSVMGGAKNELFYVVYCKGKPFAVLNVGFVEVVFLYEEESPYVEPAGTVIEQQLEAEEDAIFFYGSGKPMEPKKLEQQSYWGGWPMAVNYRLPSFG